jgi:ribose transport system ATP-binding protein
MLNRSVAENLTITRLSDSASAGVIDQSRQTAEAESLISALEIKAYSAWQPVAELSGGNQQKVALGRLLHHEASIMILDEPTRGVDIVSKTQIYRIMGDLAAAGKSIIFISSYLPELLAVCDTIGVMYRGEIAQVKPAADWTEEQLLGATMGQ